MKMSLASLFAVGALALLPAVASAGGRFGGDRGFRGGGRSHSFFGISLGFGSGGWCGDGFSTRFSYNNFGGPIYRGSRYYGGYYGAGYCASPVVVVPSAPVVYSPPVVYTAPPVIYSAPPVVYSAPTVAYSSPVYSAPAVVTTPVRTYYYSGSSCYYGGGYVYRR